MEQEHYGIMTVETEDYVAVSYALHINGWYVESPSNSYLLITTGDNDRW